jgi:adenylate cyclase
LLPDGAELAIGMFRRSAELDPQFAPALTAWALVLLFQATGLSRAPFATTMAEAEIVARRAVDIAPNEADARGVLAQALLFRGDFTGAETHIGKAQEIDRGAPMTLRAAGALLVFTGRFEQGREALRAYLRRNPHDVWRAGALAQIVFSYYCEGYYHEALAEAREAIQQVPTHGLSYRWAAAALGQLGQQAEAVAMLRQAREVSPTAFAFFTDGRPPPFIQPEYHAHMLEGLRKAGWHE